MSDQIAFRYTKGEPGMIGIPARDITVAEFEAMSPLQRRQVKRLAAYTAVETPEIDDPLRSLSNEDYAKLTPAQKAARTREANRLAESGEGATETGQEGDE